MSDLYLEKNSSQDPAVELLVSMGYEYISPEKANSMRNSMHDVLLRDVLFEQLKKINKYEYAGEMHEFSNDNIYRAITDLDVPLTEGLVSASKTIFEALSLGGSYKELLEGGNSLNFNINYIDWKDFSNNVFHVTDEFQVESTDKEHNARPDIVLFINGIPFGVIECKSPLVSVETAIKQMVRNQKNKYIPQLFKFSQILFATNKNNVKYGTTRTGLKHWNVWNEQDTDFLDNMLTTHIIDRMPTVQDKNIISIFSKERISEFIRYFILYDGQTKKISRYQQYFAIKETAKTIVSYDDSGKRNGGVIWHTQGSGKSLTMVMLSKYILMELRVHQPKVIIITDRKELDNQIYTTFANTDLIPAKARTGRDLFDLISEEKADVVTTIINKFDTAERLKAENDSKNIFVLVDECHRTNYGGMATKMRIVFPNATYIGFTGTPLTKKEKNTMAKFGKIIHQYTIKDGVKDGAIVPLIYEGRFVDQNLDQANIDLWFKKITQNLNDKQKQDLQNKWSSIQKLTSTDARIRRITLDINEHFVSAYKDTEFNAMLATNSKVDAVRYYRVFEELNDITCAVVISPPDMRESNNDDDDEVSNNIVTKFWEEMMEEYNNSDAYETTIKNKFLDGEIDILIVCSKLLTGFDAPRCHILYNDKELKEHGLLQAIARTNRLYDGKDYGSIVDYRGLITKLNDALDMYTGAGLENFDSADLKGTIVDIFSIIGDIRQANTNLEDLFMTLKNKRDIEEVEAYLADEKIREDFYKYLCQLGKYLSMVLNSELSYSAIDKEELQKFKDNFSFYSKLRRTVKIRYCDAIDNSEYEPQMQKLLDKHLSAGELKPITKPINILDKEDFEREIEQLTSDKAKADSIASSMTKTLVQKRDENPAYYDNFAEKIRIALDEYKNRIITATEYLEKLKTIMDDFTKGKSDVSYPEKIKQNLHAQAFYGVICGALDGKIDMELFKEQVVDITIEITRIIENNNQVDWSSNQSIHNQIAQDIDNLFFDMKNAHSLDVDFDTVDMVIENVKTVALRRF